MCPKDARTPRALVPLRFTAQSAVNLFGRKVVRLFASILYMAKNLPFTATTASRQKSRLTVANTATTFFSLQPHISK